MFDPTKHPATLADMAQRAFVGHAEKPCLGAKSKATGTYHYATYSEIGTRVKNITGALMSFGLQRGQRVAILAENRPEWAIADLGCQMMGLITVPMFSTLPSGQVRDILDDCGASLVFVSTRSQLQKIEAVEGDLPSLRLVVVMDELEDLKVSSVAADQHSAGDTRKLTFSQLETLGVQHHTVDPTAFDEILQEVEPDDVATIIYTSGTTGEAKGVMLMHRNILANLQAIITAIELSSDDVFLSFLPLAHIYERTAGYYLPLRLGARIGYCESLFTVDKNLREVQPTIMFCVPRLYESMREKLYSAAAALPENKRGQYLEALELAQKAGAARGKLPGAPALRLGEQMKFKLFDMVVYSKIREKFGGRLRDFVSGGAPMAPELGALFVGLGLEILEGYGLTETSPVIAVNRPGEPHLGTVGKVLENVDIRIAEDGEILVRGDSIMKGYWEKPEATAAALDENGWFHTGDIGTLEDGLLRITDRKKDLLVLANGKKVAPAPIELRLTQSKYIAQAVLLGDKQKAVSALIVPQMEAVREYAAKQNLGVESDEQLLETDDINRLIRREVDTLTDHLADFERIRKITLLPQPFSVETGEMTPTLKIKRRVVAEKYGALAEAE
jgi:long-chain acyl-CoA synthetase